MLYSNRKKGFTLIELLVVISIISLLSSIVLSSLNVARAKARDARRKQELVSLRNAILLYYDSHGTMPINRNPCCGYPDYSPNFLQELVTDGYFSTIPKSPSSPSSNPYVYYDYGAGSQQNGIGIGVLLVTQLESVSPSTTGLAGSCRPWSPGANWCDQSSNLYYCF